MKDVYRFRLIFSTEDNRWYQQISKDLFGDEILLGLLGPYYDAMEAMGALDKDFRKWNEENKTTLEKRLAG